MRRMILIVVVGIMMLAAKEGNAINIREAVEKKIIRVEIIWKSPEETESASRMHATNLRLSIKNLSNGNTNIEVPSGFLFTPRDSSAQNMIITETIIFTIQPFGQSIRYIHGYCTESNDRAPHENEIYCIRKPANEKLIQLSEYIHMNGIEGYGVQRALWCISNNHNLDQISTTDSTITIKLIEYIGRQKGLTDKQIQTAIASAMKKNGKTFEKIIEMEIPVENDTYLWIAIHDINNRTVRLVVGPHRVEKGMYKRNIGVSSIEFGAGTFTIRVYSAKGFFAQKQFKLDA